MVAYRHQVDAVVGQEPRDGARYTTLQNAAFIEAKIVILTPFVYHISIFSLIMVLKIFGPIHGYMRPWIGANFQHFFGPSHIP